MSSAHLLYVPTDKLGYGRMGVKLAAELQKAGVEICDTLDEGQAERHHVASWCSIPAHLRGYFKDQYISILTMWEATRLPESMRENLSPIDLVMVPSQQNVELFSQYHDNVQYLPLGIDPDDWQFMRRMPPENEFRFMVGGSGPRKGLDLVAAAYRKLWGKDGSWGSGPTPVLMFKSPNGRVEKCIANPEPGQIDVEDVPLIQDRMKIIPGRLDSLEEIELYAYAHCYVQPSRGEGFGLQPLQAIAQGLPTILTDAHGHASFAKLGFPISAQLTTAAYFSQGFAGEWWEPDLDELCDRMKWIYENYDAACVIAEAASKLARAKFSWARTAERWIQIHGSELDKPYQGNGDWVIPDPDLFPVVTNKRWRANVAGINYDIPFGETVFVPADVKRILYEGKHLDPACLDDTRGLTAPQLEKLGLHIARDGFCHACGQQLNSGPTRSDLIFEELQREFAARGN